MFDMGEVGRRISAARKEKNMTQMELADRLNISFQAVSNWERGVSMPDISKLPELAELFGTTVDDLLGQASPLINGIVSEPIDEYLKDNKVTVQEIKEAAPLLKPEQVDKIFENCESSGNLSEIMDLLPFLGRETCAALLDKFYESGDMKSVSGLALFAGHDAVDTIADKLIKADMSIRNIVIGMSSEKRNQLALDGYEQKGIRALDDFLPFVGKDVLSKVADIEYEKSGLRNLDHIAPFMNKNHLNELAKRAIEKDGIKAISPIAPFLNKDLLREYVKEKFL
jgi:transcriptional regulator with XRE-family HTH domain